MRKETLRDLEFNETAARQEDGAEAAAPELANFPAAASPAKHFRRLKRNELVSHGDFVSNNGKGFELWEGPSGFQAGSFVKAIYRRSEVPAILGQKTK